MGRDPGNGNKIARLRQRETARPSVNTSFCIIIKEKQPPDVSLLRLIAGMYDMYHSARLPTPVSSRKDNVLVDENIEFVPRPDANRRLDIQVLRNRLLCNATE